MSFEYTEQLMERVTQTPVLLDPFPHLVLQNVFKADHYEEIQGSFLEPAEMETLPGGSTDRFVVPLCQKKNWGLDGDPRKALWLKITEELHQDAFNRAFLKVFEPYAQLNPKTASLLESGNQKLILVPRTLLTRDLNSYFLGPHKDDWDKFATLLLYLPKTADSGLAGTSFFTPKDKSKTFDTYKHHPFDEFDFVDEVPFAPNTGLLFLKTDESYHGVRPIFAKVPPRDLLIHNIYVSKLD